MDWLCLPRFDSPACFANLLGDTSNGYWRISPAPAAGPVSRIGRRYRDDTLILETEFETAGGVVRLVDCMPLRESHPRVMRMVEGIRGRVEMRMDLVMRFDYGSVVPWVRRSGPLLTALAGPDALSLWASVEVRGEDLTVSDSRRRGQRRVLRAHLVSPPRQPPRPANVGYAIEDTEGWWRDWAASSPWRGRGDPVVRSLLR